jgi:hypothetical protein
MRPTTVCFKLTRTVPLAEVQGTLDLARLAAGSLHGPERIELEAPSAIDPATHSVTFDTTTDAGRSLAIIFFGYVKREFGADAVRMLRCDRTGVVS